MERLMFKKIVIISLFLQILAVPCQAACMQGNSSSYSYGTSLTAGLAFAGAFAATLYGLSWLRTPYQGSPSLEDLNVTSLMPQANLDKSRVYFDANDKQINLKTERFNKADTFAHGPINIKFPDTGAFKGVHIHRRLDEKEIKESPYIYIYCRGSFRDANSNRFNCNDPSYSAFTLIRDGIITGPCITFDPIDTRTALDFGQKLDQKWLTKVMNAILAINSRAKFILIGNCRGATTILNTVAFNSGLHHAIAAIMVESPLISFCEFLRGGIGGSISPALARFILPAYDASTPTILDAKSFPNVPLFIGSLKHDLHCSPRHMRQIIDALENAGCTKISSYVCRRKDVVHGRLYKDPKYYPAMRDFSTSLKLH